MGILNLILTIFLFLRPDDNCDWKLRKADDGIVVYTRRVKDSPFDEFKAIVLIPNTSVISILNIILDVRNDTNLVPDCTESKILFQKGNHYFIHYFTIRAPWPVKDRDAIYESVATVSDDGSSARISLSPLGNYLAEKKNYVRMYNGLGYWELEEVADKSVKVTYQFHGDPAGKIPGWLANSVIVSNPFKTLQNLRKLAVERSDEDPRTPEMR